MEGRALDYPFCSFRQDEMFFYQLPGVLLPSCMGNQRPKVSRLRLRHS